MDEKLRALKQRMVPGDRDLLPSVVERIGDKWSMMVLGVVTKKPCRFTDLADVIPGISRRMLTVTLRHLERDGLITRQVSSEAPSRVEYVPTELGLSLRTPLAVVLEWALDHRDEILANRDRYDSSQTSSVL